VIWLLIDSVMMCLLLLSRVVVVAAAVVEGADQKPDDDLKKMLLCLLEILFQIGAHFCLKECSLLILNHCFPLLTLNLPIFVNPPKKFHFFVITKLRFLKPTIRFLKIKI